MSEKGWHGDQGHPAIHGLVCRRAVHLPQRKALFEEQRSHMEAELEQMNRTLDMLKFKCWYYEQAIKDGSEDRLKALIPDHLPKGIQKAYENAHS